MNKHLLAIPAVTLLACAFALPSRAQTPPDTPPSPPPAAEQASSTEPISLTEQGRLLLVRKEFREAEAVFRQLIEEQPKNPVYWNELGITLQNQGDLKGALKCYEKSMKLDAAYPDAQNNIGTVWYERKKYSKAIRAYNKAIGIRDDFAPFHMNLGYAYFSEKEYTQSLAAFRRALEIDPASFDPSKSRAGTVIQDRSLSSDRGKFYFLLAKSFAQAGNMDRCILYLRKARDEGYKDFYTELKSDPSFAAARQDPVVQDLLIPKPAEPVQQP